MILISTVTDDVHALEVQRRVLARGYRDCFILESDGMSGHRSISFGTGRRQTSSVLRTREGHNLSVGAIELIWFRRVAREQRGPESDDPVERDLIAGECRDSLTSLLDTQFTGKWISTPVATSRASNKLVQLIAASKCGFRIPDSLVTQSKDEIADFYGRHHGNVIVKPIAGTSKKWLGTRMLESPAHIGEASYLACPTLCQEFIPGTRHIRLNVFGESSYAVLMESTLVDCRLDLNVPMNIWPVPTAVHQLTRRVLDELGLEMGVVDLKETPDGELVWLEVNPQGQFLYLEPLAQLNIGDRFVDYVLGELGGT